jgi:hypothetical protein
VPAWHLGWLHAALRQPDMVERQVHRLLHDLCRRCIASSPCTPAHHLPGQRSQIMHRIQSYLVVRLMAFNSSTTFPGAVDSDVARLGARAMYGVTARAKQ